MITRNDIKEEFSDFELPMKLKESTNSFTVEFYYEGIVAFGIKLQKDMPRNRLSFAREEMDERLNRLEEKVINDIVRDLVQEE